MAATPTPTSYSKAYLEEDKSYQVTIPVSVFVVLLVLTSFLRFCSRRIQRGGFMWADILMPISLLFNLAQCTTAYLAIRWGAGRHIQAVSPSDQRQYGIISFYALPCMYLGAVTFPKLAILDLYLNIFVDRFTRYTSYLVGAIITLSAIVNYATILTQCTPFSYAYDKKPGGHCENIAKHYTWVSIPNIVTDVTMLALPLPAIWKLRATWRIKLGLFITFLVGSLGLATSLVRFIQFLKFSWFGKVADPTWDTIETLIWTVTEPSIYHIAACLLTFRPLFRWLFRESALAPVLSRICCFDPRGGSRRATSDASTAERKLSASGGGKWSSSGRQPNFLPPDVGYDESHAAAYFEMDSSASKPSIEGIRDDDAKAIRVDREVEVVKTTAIV